VCDDSIRPDEAASRERVHLALERFARTGGWDWNIQTNQVFWTDELYRIYGRRPSDGPPPLDGFLEHIHPDDRQELQAAIETSIRTRSTYAIEYRLFRYDDGVERAVRAEGEVLLDASGAPERLVGCVQDITEIRRTETELRQAVDELRLAVETAGLGIWRLDVASGAVEWNDRLFEIYGVRGTDFAGRVPDWQAMVHPDDLASAAARFEQAVGGESVYDVQFRIRRPDGEVRYISASATPIRDVEGTVAEVVGINLDVTTVREQEAALREREQFLRAVFENSLAAIIVAADDGTFLSVNQAAADLFRRPVDELVGLNVREIPTAENPRSEDRYRSFMEAGQEFDEFVFLLPDGERRVAQYHAVRISDDLNLSVLMDVTERRILEERIQHAEKMEAVGRLAGEIAHDFNNIITVLNGYADVLDHGLGADHPLITHVKEIRSAGTRAADVVQELLTFSRREPVEPRVVDLHALLRGIEPILVRLVGERVSLAVHPGAADARVKLDPGQFERVILNLLTNARDAMPDGGTLFVRTGFDPEASVDRDGPTHPGVVTIQVTDTGEGMDARTRARCFEPFFTTKERGKGTGLGLASTYGIVHQIGGTIDVESEPGRGTTFVLRLPWCPEPTTAIESGPDAADPGTGGGRETILVVEDECPLRRLLMSALSAAGHEVQVAEDGIDALEQFGGHLDTIDLVLTDLVMPRMGGRELAEHLHARAPDLPVVFMTGYSDDPLPDGVDPARDLIRKPFGIDELTRRIRRRLDVIERR